MATENSLSHFICGDCTEVLKQLDTESIDLILTSPPYADQRDYGASCGSLPT